MKKHLILVVSGLLVVLGAFLKVIYESGVCLISIVQILN